MSESDQFKTNVTLSDMSIQGDGTVRFFSRGLTNALVRNTQAGLAKIQEQVVGVNLDDISFDDEGRVVINNAEFAQEVFRRMMDPTIAAGSNGICSNANC
jgi:hypothetical protein